MVSHRPEQGKRIALLAVPAGLAVVAWLALLLVLVVVSVLAVGLAPASTGQPPAPTSAVNDSGEYRVTAAGTRYTVHPSELRQGCPGGTDCIPSIDDPTFQSADEADWLASGDLVIGVEIDGETRAYPLRILNVHEIVNDEVGGLPLAVVEDPEDGSLRIFLRQRDDETLRFSVTDEQLVDQQGHRWSFGGEALEGPREGTRLEEIPTHGVYWFAWSSFHPETGIYGGDGTAG